MNEESLAFSRGSCQEYCSLDNKIKNKCRPKSLAEQVELMCHASLGSVY